ncbi:MAG: Gfo/Idh/MocA family oxidoreductase [Dehalococcoidia bacterium]
MNETIRLGVIGAGNYTRNRMLPNFLRQPGIEVAAVANRSMASAEKIAKEFEIPEALDDWRAVIARDDIDAVLIGAPPYVHLEVTTAAMDSGKDVLCQTRMSRTLPEAQQMLQKAKDTGRKTALVRPSRYVTGGRYVQHLLQTGYVGNVRQVFCYRLIPDYADSALPMGTRQNFDFYGELNCLYLGYCWDVLHSWFGEPQRVLAHALNFTPQRPAGPDGPMTQIRAAEAVTAIAQMESGATVTSIQSGVAFFGEDRTEIYGDAGTLVYKANSDLLLGGRKGDKELSSLEVPAEFKDAWTVERDFVRLVRDEIPEMFLTFEDGVKNMEYLEACHRSANEGRWVSMPLA